jgi:hypothetical protein
MLSVVGPSSGRAFDAVGRQLGRPNYVKAHLLRSAAEAKLMSLS